MKYAIMGDARALGCEEIILLGDITRYGYNPKKALEFVRENFDIVLMGNHDFGIHGS